VVQIGTPKRAGLKRDREAGTSTSLSKQVDGLRGQARGRAGTSSDDPLRLTDLNGAYGDATKFIRDAIRCMLAAASRPPPFAEPRRRGRGIGRSRTGAGTTAENELREFCTVRAPNASRR